MSTPSSQLLPDRGDDSSVAARVAQLYESHGSLVRSVCGSLLRDRVEAEDAAQQTFLSAQRALANGSAPRDAAAWLATIARHESLARVRARMREPLPLETEVVGAGSDAHADAVRRQEVEELRTALAGLPAPQRDAILLREVRGLSYEEVASALSVTNSAVESLLFRARRTLQMQLRETLAALSPGMWLQPLREFGAKLGGGLAMPAAAKVAAVGLGTAVVAGGAVVDPGVIGLGHAPHTGHATLPRKAAAATLKGVDPATVWTGSAQQALRAVVDSRTPEASSSRQEYASRTETSDQKASPATSEQQRTSDGSGGTSEQSSSASSGATGESGDGSSSRTVASGGGQPAADSGGSVTVAGSASTDSGSVSTDSGSVSTDSGSGATSGDSAASDD